MNGEILSINESRNLERLESIVAKGRQTFVEVGEALAEIRDRKLYRIDYETFEANLETKWQLSRSRACRLIQAAATAKMLPTGNKPTSERQVRPLIKLPPAERAAVWCEASAVSPTGEPTGEEVAVVVERKAAATHISESAAINLKELRGMSWLQIATHAYRQLNAKDRQLFRNFQTGFDRT